mgnify:FL=1
MPLPNQLTMDLVGRDNMHEGWDSRFEVDAENVSLQPSIILILNIFDTIS